MLQQAFDFQPFFDGAGTRSRTRDLLITSQLRVSGRTKASCSTSCAIKFVSTTKRARRGCCFPSAILHHIGD